MTLPKPEEIVERAEGVKSFSLSALSLRCDRSLPPSPVTENVLRNDTTAAPREDDADGQGREPEAIAVARVRLSVRNV